MFSNNPFGFADFDDFGDLFRRPAPPKPAVTVEALVARGISHVKVGDKIYRIECTEYKGAVRK